MNSPKSIETVEEAIFGKAVLNSKKRFIFRTSSFVKTLFEEAFSVKTLFEKRFL
jgi:hypothetical protein